MGESVAAKLKRYLRSEGIVATAKRSFRHAVFLFRGACLERVYNNFDADLQTKTGGPSACGAFDWARRLQMLFATSQLTLGRSIERWACWI